MYYKKLTNTLFLGKEVIFMTECHSTNTLASEIGKNNDFLEGTLVVAEYQRAGRGQRGASWVSERGKNLTFSILLRPSFLPIEEHFLLNAVVSLGVYDYLKSLFGTCVHIKWPNDILVAGKKLCGILIENQIGTGRFIRSVVGIGLNVNQLDFHGFSASSLRIVSGKEYDLSDTLGTLLLHIERMYMMLGRGHYAQIRKKYTSALFSKGKSSIFEAAGKRFEGTVLGVDIAGRLMLEVDGVTQVFTARDIQLVQ